MSRVFLWVPLFLCWPAAAFGQVYNPYAPPPYSPTPYTPAPKVDARERRAAREKAVAFAGPESRPLVEDMGDDAVAAISACSQGVAQKLAKFHTSANLSRLPRPHDLLRVIGQTNGGDDVALWAIEHEKDLEDVDCFDAYLQNPLEFALNLKQISQGAAEVRANRLAAASAPPAPAPLQFQLPAEWVPYAVGGGVLCVVLLLVWMLRSRRSATVGV